MQSRMTVGREYCGVCSEMVHAIDTDVSEQWSKSGKDGEGVFGMPGRLPATLVVHGLQARSYIVPRTFGRSIPLCSTP